MTLYSTFVMKTGVNESGKTWSPNIIQLTVHPQTPPNAALVGRRDILYSRILAFRCAKRS